MMGNLYDKLKEELQSATHEELEERLFNYKYNDFCSDWADNKEEKRIPYMGWFWRSTNFFRKEIPIGFEGSFVGVMENNKWDHPERCLTPEEFEVFINYIDMAMQESKKGGILSEIEDNVNKHLQSLWDWMQTLPPPNTART